MTSASSPAAVPGPVPSGREQIASAAAGRSLSEIEVAWADTVTGWEWDRYLELA
jgi:hypothetical protein